MIVAIILIAAAVALFFVTRQFLIPAISPRPDDLGVTDGQLKSCPRSPNCVASQADPSDRTHYMEPLPFEGDVTGARDDLLAVLNDMDGMTLITVSDNYIYAEFRSPLMQFIDDVEFYIDPASSVVHFRSASRIGDGDMDTNRKRMRSISAAFAQRRLDSAGRSRAAT
jgi:uncharacterized protein (DUF1499 family)